MTGITGDLYPESIAQGFTGEIEEWGSRHYRVYLYTGGGRQRRLRRGTHQADCEAVIVDILKGKSRPKVSTEKLSGGRTFGGSGR